MDRRDYLAVLSSVGAATLAGCSIPGQSRTLSNPTTEEEDDGETHLFFTADTTRVATVSIQPGRDRYDGPGGTQIPVDISISHADRTKITSLTLALRTLTEGGKPPAEAALLAPFGTPHPGLELYTDPADGGTVLTIPDARDIGSGTVTLKLLLSSVASSTTEMALDATIDLSEHGLFGTKYTLSSITTIPLPTKNA